MAEPHAIPEEQSDKKQGDKLERVVDSVLDKDTGLTQDTAGKSAEPTPQSEPLK